MCFHACVKTRRYGAHFFEKSSIFQKGNVAGFFSLRKSGGGLWGRRFRVFSLKNTVWVRVFYKFFSLFSLKSEGRKGVFTLRVKTLDRLTAIDFDQI